jgi:hypothetical protein
MMNSILPFTSALSGASTGSLFMAIRTEAPDGGQFHRLTPRVMIWDETTYLLDLTPVRRYWSHHAEHQQQNLSEYLTEVLSSDMTQTQQAATATHPWIALLLLSSVADRPALKLVDGLSMLGRKLLDDLTCEQWINRVRELREPLAAAASKTPNNTQKKTNLGSLSPLIKTIDRMGLKHIRDLNDIDVPAMERRFGKLAATAWKWTTTHTPTKSTKQRSLFDDTFRDDFPWQNITPKETPSITRFFEHPVRLWDHISPHLMEDFDRICNLTCWSSNERVVSLEWELSFSCSPPLRIPVLFRHPHALHSESGHHKTALLQAFHSWQRAMNSRQKPCHHGDSYIVEDSITEWRLVITERLILTPQLQGLFTDDLSTDCSHLMRLENSLGVPLFAYTPTDHWTPERSFTADRRGFEHVHMPSGSIARFAMNQRRPLFIYTKPELPIDHAQSCGLIFSERVGIDWWSDIPAGHSGSCRDYYIRMTDDGLLQWVFYTDDGSIKVHGIYG